MGLFSFMGKNIETGSGDSNYNEMHPLLGLKQPLTYKECMDIFLNWALGKRVASSLVEFALSVKRDIYFKDLPDEFSERFKEIEEKYNIDNIVKRSAIYTRVFGMSGIFVSHKKKQPHEKLSFDDVLEGDISFNICDPLVLSGTTVSQDPLSVDYMKVNKVMVRSQEVDLSRICVLFNSIPFYLEFQPSTFTFATPSVYQNMIGLIHSWNRCVVALERAATKAGSIIFKNRNGGALNSIAASAINKTLEAIRSMQNDGAVSIEKDADVELFNLSGIGEIDSIINQMNSIIMMALSDTPSALLLDRNLSNGLNDGSEDMKAIIMAVDNFRSLILKNIYDFIDRFLLYLTLDKFFLKEMLEKYSSDFKGLNEADLREKAMSSFYFKYGNLYPETEATKIDNIGRKLDNLGKLKELGANLADIQDVLNENNQMFFKDITLNEKNIEDEESEGMDYLETNPKEIRESKIRQGEANQDVE